MGVSSFAGDYCIIHSFSIKMFATDIELVFAIPSSKISMSLRANSKRYPRTECENEKKKKNREYIRCFLKEVGRVRAAGGGQVELRGRK